MTTSVEAYALGPTYLTSQDKKVGKYADMIVLDKNIFDIPPTEIGSTKVLQTIVNGKVVFDTANCPSEEDAIERLFKIELDFGDVGEGTSHGRWHGD